MNKKSSFSAIGASSLLVIFAVLCLVTFATLCISTVQADKRLSEKSNEAILNYYSADCKAQKFMADFKQGIVDKTVKFDLENGIYSYYFAVSDTQSLVVLISEDDSEILGTKLVSTTEWTENEDLTVWDGEIS